MGLDMKPDPKLMTPEQHDKLESWQQAEDQLQSLQDIATMTQEVIGILDDSKKAGLKNTGDVGAVLLDIRRCLNSIEGKKDPVMPDYAKPVVEAVSKLEKALSDSIKTIDVKPTVEAPKVSVDAPQIDLSGVEKLLKNEIPKAFNKSIGLIPTVEIPETDFKPLLTAWEGISEQLVSLENATRMKPIPGKMTVTNADGSEVRSPSIFRGFDDIQMTNDDGNGNYQTITFNNNGQTVSILSLSFDSANNVTAIART